MSEELEHILSQLTLPDNAAIQKVLWCLVQVSCIEKIYLFKNEYILFIYTSYPISGHCSVETGFQRPGCNPSTVRGYDRIHRSTGGKQASCLLSQPFTSTKSTMCATPSLITHSIYKNKQKKVLLLFYFKIRQSAVVMLRMRVKKHWKKIIPEHRERFRNFALYAFWHLYDFYVPFLD